MDRLSLSLKKLGVTPLLAACLFCSACGISVRSMALKVQSAGGATGSEKSRSCLLELSNRKDDRPDILYCQDLTFLVSDQSEPMVLGALDSLRNSVATGGMVLTRVEVVVQGETYRASISRDLPDANFMIVSALTFGTPSSYQIDQLIPEGGI
jgi:hypothetical protein